MFECYYTPIKGTASCRDCRFNYLPSQHDGVCLLPESAHSRASVGLEPVEPFNQLMQDAYKKAIQLEESKKKHSISQNAQNRE